MTTGFPAVRSGEAPPRPVAGSNGSAGTLFAGCPELVGSPLAYRRDEEVYGEGEEADFVYRVLKGAVRSHRVLSDGRRQITGFHLPGDLFGFEPGDIHRQTAEALSDTRVLAFPRRQVERTAAHRAEVACLLWGLATNDLHHAQDLALLLGRRSATERIAAFLIEVDERLGGGGRIALPMTRRDIADYLGLTIETVSRTLSQLEGDGALVRAGGRQISLHRARLGRMVKG